MAQQVVIAGAMFNDVPSISVPDANSVYHPFVDPSVTTAAASDVAQGKQFIAADGTLTTGTASGGGGHEVAWWGGIDPELIGETRWSAAVTEAANWPLTPSTSTQFLTWVTSYTSTANRNAVIDRIGKGYHGVTETLDFGVWNYIIMEDAFVHYEYTSPEASLGKAHMLYNGFTAIYHYGARPRSQSGVIIRPSTTTRGAYNSCSYAALLSEYRTAAGALSLTDTSSYGVGTGSITQQMNSVTSITPDYFNVNIPTFSICAGNTYMPVASYNELDWTKTTVNFRNRIYRVPVEYGVYTVINDRLLDMIQDETFPVEPL